MGADRRVSRPGRVLALDLGGRRIGVAVSDSDRRLATPRTTLARTGDAGRDRGRIVALVAEEEARLVVVGLPLSLDGNDGPAAAAARGEAAALAADLAPLGVGVETFDERLTTVSAAGALTGAGVPARRQRSVIDTTAATVLLQAWLDGARRRVDGDPG